MDRTPQTVANPYAAGWRAYYDAGWRGILPLPYGLKAHPPEGFTGYHGEFPSYADLTAWEDNGPQNIGLRVQRTEIGIDVDDYDGKAGGQTLHALVNRYGALPFTFLSSSRDGISGIRPYRVEAGTVLPTKLPGIEFIQYHHRYIVAAPSMHPQGRPYRWIDERTGEILNGPPRVDDLPLLPAAWVTGLRVEAKQYARTALDEEGARDIVSGFPLGEPCSHVLHHAGKAMTAGDRHDTYNEAVLAVVGAGRRGCPGAAPVVSRLHAAFVAEITDPRTGRPGMTVGDAEAEWRRNLLGALQIVASEDQGTSCPDDALDWIDAASVGPQSATGAPLAAPEDETAPTVPTAFESAVKRRLGDLLVTEAAREALAARQAGEAPALAGIDLAAFLDQPDSPTRYRVDGLWPCDGRVMLAAAAKAGKTTVIVGNVIPCLLDGGYFLGTYETAPVARRVVYVNAEVGEGTMRRWLRRSAVHRADALTVVNVRGSVSALTLGSAAGRARFAGFLRDHEADIVILDPLAPLLASLGLDENSNSDIAKFFAYWSETMKAAGVADDLLVHHTGHAGERSRGASRLLDEPDAIWTLTRAAIDNGDPFGPEEMRFIKATGRDVELAETALTYEASLGRLTLEAGVNRHNAGNPERRDAVLEHVREHPGVSRDALARAVGGRKAATLALIESFRVAGTIHAKHGGLWPGPERPGNDPGTTP